MTNPSIASDDFERAKRVIAEQGEGLTLEQVTAQRDLWIMSASEWEGRLVAAETALSQLTREVDELREALAGAKRGFQAAQGLLSAMSGRESVCVEDNIEKIDAVLSRSSGRVRDAK